MLIVLARHPSTKNSSYHRKNTFVLHTQYQSVFCLVKSICCPVAFPKFFCNVGCCPYSFIKSHSSGIQSCTLVAFLPERPKLYHTRSKKKTPCQNCVSFRKYPSEISVWQGVFFHFEILLAALPLHLVKQLVRSDGFRRERVVLPPVHESHNHRDDRRHELIDRFVVDGDHAVAARAEQLIDKRQRQTDGPHDGRRRYFLVHFEILRYTVWMGNALARLYNSVPVPFPPIT
nr:MAG TPA: hypothetical protein [Bacteriophage sp.]